MSHACGLCAFASIASCACRPRMMRSTTTRGWKRTTGGGRGKWAHGKIEKCFDGTWGEKDDSTPWQWRDMLGNHERAGSPPPRPNCECDMHVSQCNDFQDTHRSKWRRANAQHMKQRACEMKTTDCVPEIITGYLVWESGPVWRKPAKGDILPMSAAPTCMMAYAIMHVCLHDSQSS